MANLLWFLLSSSVLLVALYVPSWVTLRLLGAHRWLALAGAPAFSAAVGATTAIAVEPIGVPWGLLPYSIAHLLLMVVAWLLRRSGWQLPSPSWSTAGPLLGPRVTGPALLSAAIATALVPIASAFGRADGILERWDTLYHLNQLRRIRDSGDASSLTFGQIASTTGDPAMYPAAFHDLASLDFFSPIPVALNAAAASLAIVPWCLGLAVLARVLWPRYWWSGLMAACAGALAPAAPVNEWIHLSPIPNLTGVAMLPGFLACAYVWWISIASPSPGSGCDGARFQVPSIVLTAGVLGFLGAGLTFMQPNVAVSALLFLAALCACTGALNSRATAGIRVAATFLVGLFLLPLALLTWTPLGSQVTHFSGGLAVSGVQAVGELVLGLLTVWPMPMGVILAALWWPGLVRSCRRGHLWVAAAWLIFAVLYLDAAVDSSLHLSILYYRGQDRLSMVLALLGSLLVVPGIAAWADFLRGTSMADGRDRGASHGMARISLRWILIATLIVGTVLSWPFRATNASLNATMEHPTRGRFLQADELAAFAEHADDIRGHGAILASPFSGASHMYAIHDMEVRFPVAGMVLTQTDGNLIASAELAADSPVHCQALKDHGIGFVYQDVMPYQHVQQYALLLRDLGNLGPEVFTTSHSRLIKVECHGTDSSPA